MSAEDGNLLVVIVDTNPSIKLVIKGKNVLTHCLDSVMVFANSHLMISPLNKLAVIACHSHKSAFLFPKPQNDDSEDDRPTDGQYELFVQVDRCVKDGVKQLVLESPQETLHMESVLAGAMSMALCYIHRIEREEKSRQKLSARILVVTASGDSAAQYMNFMNVFFTAQKQNVVIDACVLDKDSSLLQQGCDITGGCYLKVTNVSALLQYLLWVFLPDAKTRKQLVQPPPVHVDYRAACFCHRELIDTGYVCSVCLSIFCAFSPICSTCQTAFKLAPISALKPRKKKTKTGL
ncbi:transcription factor B4 isoform X1 [Tachypleus tridentatus]|uniref:transcription factor B4 isoform X1 n=2 Tax=Tachypleus tridentatus TaxID=6853 RepID=UPI003FD32ABF